ncbi:KH domain-containing protein [Desulfurivibrio alkaliphilus]|uniref:RNA-binding protein KhpA n=1 Tax=Desulfurivibrio alkaliphilus (strain DSM 19089 / UNIQEM U267 / AHT2) TaxID=589865 RepID=D6Z2U5_DESAT|nr:KH domain-containing protein [Desulfurivibrio alkaliphilus]ADH85870.1 conserved hypothetical protein [Desulfurivibrio alkaliphilus AHT 2]
MRELVEFVARGLVDNPEAVTVDESTQDDTLLLELRVDQGDLGKVIGRQGRTARTIRTLLTATGGERKVRLEIVE